MSLFSQGHVVQTSSICPKNSQSFESFYTMNTYAAEVKLRLYLAKALAKIS
jgi:hypothetical protein